MPEAEAPAIVLEARRLIQAAGAGVPTKVPLSSTLEFEQLFKAREAEKWLVVRSACTAYAIVTSYDSERL